MVKIKTKSNKACTLKYEKRCARSKFELVVGLDEAGRGPLAGPVFAAAVAVKNTFCHDKKWKYLLENVKDSKKIRSGGRKIVYQAIISHPNVIWASAAVGQKTIDRINISGASKLAMRRAFGKLKKQIKKKIPDNKTICLIDGDFRIKVSCAQESVIAGDAKIFSIAAASIVAKVQRDRLMEKMDGIYPVYGFARHKGYGTKRHLAAIKKYGPCPIHRRTFAPVSGAKRKRARIEFSTKKGLHIDRKKSYNKTIN